jgi:hypothetical protein
VGTSHSATGAIESALKYMSPDAHWIARRLATAGGKCIKTRPLSTAASSHYQLTSHYQSLPHLRDNSTATCPAIAGQQASDYPGDRRPARGPDYLPSERRTCTSLADRCRSPRCYSRGRHIAPATQRRSARPATR